MNATTTNHRPIPPARRRAQFTAWAWNRIDHLDTLAHAISKRSVPARWLDDEGERALFHARAINADIYLERDHERQMTQEIGAILREIDSDRVREGDRLGALARACHLLREEPTREHADTLLALVLEQRQELVGVLTR